MRFVNTENEAEHKYYNLGMNRSDICPEGYHFVRAFNRSNGEHVEGHCQKNPGYRGSFATPNAHVLVRNRNGHLVEAWKKNMRED